MGRFSDMVRGQQAEAEKKAEVEDQARAAAIKEAAEKKAADDEVMRSLIMPILEEARDDLIANDIRSAIIVNGKNSISQTTDLVVGDDGHGGYGKNNRPSRVLTSVKDGVVRIGINGGKLVKPERAQDANIETASTALTEAIEAAVKRYLGTEPR